MSLQTRVGVSDRPGVEIVSRHVVAGLGESDQQPPRAAGRFEQTPHAAPGVLSEARLEEVELRLPVGAEEQIVVLGVVVYVSADDFHHSP